MYDGAFGPLVTRTHAHTCAHTYIYIYTLYIHSYTYRHVHTHAYTHAHIRPSIHPCGRKSISYRKPPMHACMRNSLKSSDSSFVYYIQVHTRVWAYHRMCLLVPHNINIMCAHKDTGFYSYIQCLRLCLRGLGYSPKSRAFLSIAQVADSQ